MLDNIFKLSERSTNVKTEVMAGITTFMTMAYILIVQPSFMKIAGMDPGAIAVATALISAAFSIFMGVYANLPFSLAPGMGSNIFFAVTIVAGGIATWQQGIGMVFISGMVFVLLTVFGIREVVVKAIPRNIKIAIGASVGFFITLIGLKNGHFIAITENAISMGDLRAPNTMLAMIGLAICIVLMARNVKGALLWAMIATTLVGIPMGITKVPASFITMPPSVAPVAFKLDILGALKLSFFPLMFTFFVGDFFSTLGTVLGVSAKAGLLDKNGDLPNIGKPFLVDAIGTVVGSLFGLTAVTTYIESASGVEEGGRTGLTAVVTGICFLLTIFITPIAAMIPNEATAPALIIIGLLMISGIKDIEFNDFSDAFPAFATIIFTAYTSSIANGISVGIISYTFTKIIAGKAKDLHWVTYLLCIPLILYFVIM